MKKLFYLLTAAVLLLTSCREYDDSELWKSIDELRQRIEAVETVLNAYENKLFIESVNAIENGYVIIFSDGSKATIVNGEDGSDGKDGDTYIASLVVGEDEVTFTLTDGETFSIPIYSALSIHFDTEDLVVMNANSTRDIHYTVKSLITDVVVEVLSSPDIRAKVIPSDENDWATGIIKVSTDSIVDEYSKVVVLVSNGEKVIMRTFTFEEEALKVSDKVPSIISAKGGIVELPYLSNVKCEVVIHDDAMAWISNYSETRALTEKTIKFKVKPNDGHNRQTTIIIQSISGTLKLEQQVKQEGYLGEKTKIDPQNIPDNEIWYVTSAEKDAYLSTLNHEAFDANIVEHVYEDGKWIIRFDKKLTKIVWPGLGAPTKGFVLTELYLPNTIEIIESINLPLRIKEFYVPNNLKRLFMPQIILGDELEVFYGNNVSMDGRCIVLENKLVAFAPAGLEEYSIPDNVSTIGQQAVCSYELKKIIIPEGVEILENEAFMRCPNLEYINLPASLEKIGYHTFFQCRNLKKISGDCKFVSDDGYALIVDNAEGMPIYAKCMLLFASGAGLKSYEIPDGVNAIDSYCFYYATDLEELTFPSSVFKIVSQDAFLGTYNIRKIYGPNVLDDNRSLVIDDALLYVAPKDLTRYTTPAGVIYLSYGVLSQKPDLENVVISDDVIAVGDAMSCRPYEVPLGYILWNNPKLKTVTVSANMRILGMDPFGSGGGTQDEASKNIESVYLRAPIPPVIGHNFPAEVPALFKQLTIHVPKNSLDAYKNSPDWIPYKKYLKGYDYVDIPEHDRYISSDYSLDEKVGTLQTASKGKGINVVLMGDAYSDRQIADGTYKTDMINLYDNFFSEEPYKSFKDYFNVYYVNVVSATEGYEYGNTTALYSFFDGVSAGGNDNAVFNYALKAISEEEMDEALIIVAMNSDNYAGTCYMYYPDNSVGYGNGASVSYFPRGGDATTFAQLLHHEACGHGFAKLADEYAYEVKGTVPSDYVSQIKEQQTNWGWWKNVDFTSNPLETRWSHFINDTRYANEGLGAYEGGLTYWNGVWRPTENSIMNTNTGGFNAPSREAIYYRIHKLAYGDSWEYDYEEFVEWDAKNRKAEADAALLAPYRKASDRNFVPLHPPVVRNKSWRDAK